MICMIIKSLEGIELNNIHREKESSSMSACPETKSHLSKNEKVSFFSSFSLSLFILIIDEL
jgi:hypothetical protein